MAENKIDMLLDKVRHSSTDTAEFRDDAREQAIAAIRGLEQALVESLAGEPLRGLKNLGTGSQPYYGARVRGKPEAKLLWPEEPDSEAETLVIVADGHLAMAVCRTMTSGGIDPHVEECEVEDSDLRAEDVEAMLTTMAEIITRHITSAQTARERYTKLRELSDSVLRVLTREV